MNQPSRPQNQCFEDTCTTEQVQNLGQTEVPACRDRKQHVGTVQQYQYETGLNNTIMQGQMVTELIQKVYIA